MLCKIDLIKSGSPALNTKLVSRVFLLTPQLWTGPDVEGSQEDFTHLTSARC